MSTDIALFDYSGQQFRSITIDGSPWFIASDAARILGYSETAAMTRTIDGEDKGLHTMQTPGGEQKFTVISEAGLYSAILRSRVPQAKSFKYWITHEVLPQIRKTGSYGMQAAIPSHAEALRGWADAIEQAEVAEARIAELEPAAKAWGHVVDASGTVSFGDAAKALSNCDGVTIGRNRLFKQLAAWGWIYRSGSRDREAWAAKQDQVECGRLATKLNPPFLNSKTGEYEVTAPTIRITSKGLDEIYRRLATTAQLQVVGGVA